MAAAASAWIEQLALTWRSIDELCSGLTETEWKTATGCPGWTVQDNLSHLVDYEATALGRPRPDHEPPVLEHTKNALGESNEVGVDARRTWTGERVLDEFREVVAERLEHLQGLTADDLAGEVPTPAGRGTVADMLTLRVMDTWSHEQDIRRALGRPGHEDGPAAAGAVAYFAGLLPYVVGKRAGAPEGATVVVEIGDLDRRAVEVVDGRARPLDTPPEAPTATVRIPVGTFAALVGGRTDVPDDAVVTGDDALGRAVVAGLGVMP
jgi:uncharacterized protein (TIGR03083 family)